MATNKLHHWNEASWIVKFLLLILVITFIHTHTAQACTITASVRSPPYLGRGVVLQCVSTCSTPVGPIVWKKDGKEIYRQKYGGKLGRNNATDQSKRDNIHYDIYKTVLTRNDIGNYSCEKYQKGSPDILYKSSYVYLDISLSPNMWLQLASRGLNKSSFCVAGDSSISGLLKKNLVGIGLPFSVFTNISGINITHSPKVLTREVQLNLPVSTTIVSECICINCTHIPSYCNSTIRVKWPFGYRVPNGWVFLCNNQTYQAFSSHYQGVCGVGCILPALIDHPGYKHRQISRALSPDCDDNLKLLDPVAVAVVAAFILPVPGLVVGMQNEISKMACAYSKTTNLTDSVLSELNQELGEVRVAVLQDCATIDYLLLKEHMGCEQFPGMCCFNLSDFSQTIHNRIDNIHHIIDKFSQMPELPKCFSWFHWIWPVIVGLFLLCICLPVLIAWICHIVTSLLKPMHAYATFLEVMSKK
ncbi:uncharacterized protein [Manis javanica]|uniref:uncharacterized protein n=1 Tax=Manis javanica TaxID=9974 RepID=UPI003C6CD05E